MSKASSIREFLKKSPKSSNSEVAKQFKVSPNYVSALKSKKSKKSNGPNVDLKSVLQRERDSLAKKIEAIDALLE